MNRQLNAWGLILQSYYSRTNQVNQQQNSAQSAPFSKNLSHFTQHSQLTSHSMSLKVTPQIFKWLQSLSLVKQAKRTNDLLQLSEQISIKFFDGIHVAFLLKHHFMHALDDENIKKVQSLKENSNPAIRLYNWNILSEVLKKIKGAALDSAEKSKLLALQFEPLLKVLKAMFEARLKPVQGEKKGLKVQISEIPKKSLLQSGNAMEFLIITLSKNFKLSPQHTLNLFLDNNKYLSHLLVRGVKNNFNPIYDFLHEIKANIDFLVSQIFCIDEEENVQFFFNALKSCIISKDENTVWECLEVWTEIAVTYKLKGINLKHIKSWIKNEGVNTLFFTLNKNVQYFEKIIELCHLYLETDLFEFFQLTEKSLLWNSDKEKLVFFRRLISMESRQVSEKFISSQYIEEWLKHFIKTTKKLKQSDEFYDMNIILEALWLMMGEKFQDEKYNLVNTYIQLLKNSLGMKQYVNFFSAAMSLFNLIKVLGNKKNVYAPQLFKLAVTAFSNISSTQQEKVTFFASNMIHSMKQIKTLPGGSLVSVVIKHLSTAPNSSLLQLCKVMLEEKRINQQQTIQVLEILSKIIFQDVFYGEMAMQIVYEVIPGMNDEVSEEYLTSNSKLGLANFVSHAKTVIKTVKELKLQLEEEYKNSPSQEENIKVKSVLSSQLKRYLLINNSLIFLQKHFDLNDINLRNSLETMLFHTYVKVKLELKKKKVADLLLPLMKNYYDDEDQLNQQIEEYEREYAEQQEAKESASKITLLKSIKLNKSLDLSSVQTSDFKTIDPSTLKPSQFALKDLQALKQKRQHLKTIQIQKQKQTFESHSKLQQIKNFMNQKRLIEFGASGKVDFDYRNLYDFDSMKEEEIVSGVPVIRLVNFEKQEEQTYEDDLKNVMKKYRKVWRFLFFKYSTFGAKKQEFKTEEKISMAQIWKMLREYEVFSFLKKQESQTIIKLINDSMKRKNDPQCLTYPGFEEYISQVCTYAYGKSTHPHLPPGRQVLLFIEQLKKQTKQKGGSIQLFENPQDIYFQETDVIRQYNKRLKENPDYILPEGYKKYKQFSLEYEYSVHPMLQKNIRGSYVEVYEVLHEILFEKIGISLIEPLSLKGEVTLAKPILFQNINEKMKDYKKGYLQPKMTIQVKQEKTVELRKSIILKKEFRPHINFSLGIKLGLSSLSIKNKSIGEEVAYWMHDMLNAIENQSLKVDNTAKKKVENVIIKRRRVESLEKLKKQRSEKKEWKKRAQSVKVRLEMQKKIKEEQNTKKKEIEIQEKRKKRAREEQSLKKKLSRFQEMKKIISQRKQQAKYKKIQEEDKRKEKLQEYREKVAEYFQKKKEEILQKQQQMKKLKEEKEQQQKQKQQKQKNFVKQLYLANLKKEQDILEKADELKDNYEELYESEEITAEFKKYEKELLYLFNLLLKYEKSKISATAFDEIGLNTLHYFAFKFLIIPFMIEKTQLIKIFNFVIKEKQKRLQKQNDQKDIEEIQLTAGPAKVKNPGLNFKNFQQALLLIAVKAKKLLNKIKQKRAKRMEKLLEFVKERKSEDGNHFDVEEMSESEEDESDEEDEEEEKAPGLLEEYLFNVEDVDEETLRQVFVFLKLPKDKLGVEERYRAVVESKNLKPKNILKTELKKQMETVKLQDIKEEDIEKSQGSDNQE